MKYICICVALFGFDKFGELVLYKLSGDSEDFKKHQNSDLFIFLSYF